MTYAASLTVSNFLSKLQGVRGGDGQWQARCPCRNDDSNPSLSVKDDNGKVVVYCHRGKPCSASEICEAIGITQKDLFPPSATFDKNNKPKQRLVKTYKYIDSNGNLVYEKQRFLREDGSKSFLQRRPNPEKSGDWIYSLSGIDKILYNLPAVIEGVKNNEPIWVVEGEKDADALIELGIIATTGPGGAGNNKWEDSFTKALAGAHVEIVSDNDDVGKSFAMIVRSKLDEARCTGGVWLSASGKDAYDHFAAGKSFDDFIPLSDYEESPVEEQQEEPSQMDSILVKINDIFDSENLSDSQKLNRASIALTSMTISERTDTGRLVNWENFISESDNDDFDWVIPGLLERKERVIVVAAEGVGKTMLARQVAILSAAGVNPFTYQSMPPIRTLTIDLENPERIIRRTSRSIMNASIARTQLMNGKRVQQVEAHLLIKPAGIDLLSVSDRLLVEETVEKTKPDLLVLGPLYKSFIDSGNRTSEAVAVEVARFLDYIRDQFGCALWLEHHAPLGSSLTTRELRPFGSAVWSRWPEFGISLQPDPTSMEGYVYDVRHFRGGRDERPWPTKMRRGKIFPFEVLEYMKVG